MTESFAPPVPAEPLRCPVCRAALREARVCGRCGVDLGPVMQVHAAAWRCRRDGWPMLAVGDAAAAHCAAEQSLALVDSESARRLRWLAQVLLSDPGR